MKERFRFKRTLLPKSLPANHDLGLLALRLLTAAPLLLKHGLEKIFTPSTATHAAPTKRVSS